MDEGVEMLVLGVSETFEVFERFCGLLFVGFFADAENVHSF